MPISTTWYLRHRRMGIELRYLDDGRVVVVATLSVRKNGNGRASMYMRERDAPATAGETPALQPRRPKKSRSSQGVEVLHQVIDLLFTQALVKSGHGASAFDDGLADLRICCRSAAG